MSESRANWSCNQAEYAQFRCNNKYLWKAEMTNGKYNLKVNHIYSTITANSSQPPNITKKTTRNTHKIDVLEQIPQQFVSKTCNPVRDSLLVRYVIKQNCLEHTLFIGEH